NRRPAPTAILRYAPASPRTPTRGAPPHEGASPPASTGTSRRPVGQSFGSVAIASPVGTTRCRLSERESLPKAPHAGGRRGKECEASLRAEQRLAAGGAQRSPDPAQSIQQV